MRRFLILAILLGTAGAAALLSRDSGPAPDPVSLSDAVAHVTGPGQVQVYLSIANGATPNVLRSVSSPEADSARIVRAAQVVIPAGATPSLASDGAHLVLSGLEGDLDEGRLLLIQLDFDPSGPVTTRARIGPAPKMAAMSHADHGSDAVPPKLAIEVYAEDAGWVIDLDVADFTFVQPTETPVHVAGEGHGHLYLNGLKLQRVYERQVRIGALPKGRHEVAVSLNGNTHMPYRDENGPVAAAVWIEVE